MVASLGREPLSRAHRDANVPRYLLCNSRRSAAESMCHTNRAACVLSRMMVLVATSQKDPGVLSLTALGPALA